jgi:haloacetate dehalogenase
MFFEGFTLEHRQARDVTFRLRRRGKGPPLLLLHGNPQTHAMWHRVAPVLAQRFEVICPDLVGYGFTSKPPVSADHAAYSKRAMAADLVALMRGLGHAQFAVVGHDRGARVAHRMALDWPDAVQKLCLLDIVPTLHHFESGGMDFAMGYYHWFFLAQPHPKPERMILRDVEDWFDMHTSREPKDKGFFHAEARADYLAALHLPGTVAAICEDYRAAAGIDLVHDAADAEARIAAPLLVLWGSMGTVGALWDVLATWREKALDVRGHAIACGHSPQEEAPGEFLAALEGFL